MAVMEIVRINCKEGAGDKFCDSLKNGLAVQGADPECLSASFQRGVENPDAFVLMIEWTSIEAHDAWRTAHREEWRSHIWDLIDGTPNLLGHFQFVATVK